MSVCVCLYKYILYKCKYYSQIFEWWTWAPARIREWDGKNHDKWHVLVWLRFDYSWRHYKCLVGNLFYSLVWWCLSCRHRMLRHTTHKHPSQYSTRKCIQFFLLTSFQRHFCIGKMNIHTAHTLWQGGQAMEWWCSHSEGNEYGNIILIHEKNQLSYAGIKLDFLFW